MCIAIAGGIKGLERNYVDITNQHGFKCKVFNRNVPDLSKKIMSVDAVILFTDTVSHKVALQCNRICKKCDIKIRRVHSSSITQLEKTVLELKLSE